jgi:membrane protein
MHAHPDPVPVTPRTATPRRRLSPWEFTQRVASGVIQHQCMGSSAQIAYYLLFAMFPFLLSLASLLALLPIPNHVDWLLGLFAAVVPEAALELIRDSIERVVTRPHRALLTASIVLSIWAGANAVEAIIQGLHRVQGLFEDRPFWKMRILSLLLAVGVSFFALMGLLGLWFGSLVSRWWEVRGGLGPLPVEVWDFLRWPLVVLMLIVAIDQLYFLGPAARPRWRWITPGAVVAVVGWVVASLGFSSYVAYFGRYNVMYGGIGAVLILLTWMYLSSFFILLGAEINAVAGESHAH